MEEGGPKSKIYVDRIYGWSPNSQLGRRRLQFHATARCRKYRALDAAIRFAPCSFTQPLGHPNVHFCPAGNFSNLNFLDSAIDCANKCMEIPVIPFSIGQFMQRAMRLEASCSTGQSKILILYTDFSETFDNGTVE